MDNPVKGKFNFRNIIALLFVLGAIIQFMLTFYFNVFEAKEHLDIDASVEYLKTIVIGDRGGFFPQEFFHETSQPQIEKVFLIAAPIYRITGNVWLSYGLSTEIISILIILVLWFIASNIGLGFLERIIIVNLFLCPYLANGFNLDNNLSYYFCTNGWAAYYDVVALVFLMAIYILTLDELGFKNKIIAGISIAAMVYLCVSKGLGMLIWCGIPMLLYVLVKSLLKNDYKELISWKSIYIYSIVTSMLLGRLIGGLSGFTYFDSSKTWVRAGDFWDNLGNIYVGFKLLVGAIPGADIHRNPASLMGIVYVFGEVIFYVLLIAVIYAFINVINDIRNKSFTTDTDKKMLLLMIIIGNVFEYSLIDTKGNEGVFETRYLLLALLAAFVLAGDFIKSISDSLIFKQLGIVALLVSIGFMDLFSNYVLAISDNSSYKVDECLAVIEQTDAKLVYFWATEEEFTRTDRVIRVVDTSRVYKGISKGHYLQVFGDYTYYDDSKQYEGPTVVVISSDETNLPQDILEQYELLAEFDNISILYCKSNPIDLEKLTEWG